MAGRLVTNGLKQQLKARIWAHIQIQQCPGDQMFESRIGPESARTGKVILLPERSSQGFCPVNNLFD